MKKDLTLYEARVIGVLLEKEITTPDQYPLSLNALTNACNQKSNRHPVLDLSEATVNDTVEALKDRGLIRGDSYKSRVEKLSHRFCNSEFGELQLTSAQVAVVCELLLRGPQTPGELRSRAHRMHPFSRVDEIEITLQELVDHPKGPWVTVLPREPGKRESRYAHLFSSDIEPVLTESIDTEKMSASRAEIDTLKAQIARLEEENADLKQRLRRLGEVC